LLKSPNSKSLLRLKALNPYYIVLRYNGTEYIFSFLKEGIEEQQGRIKPKQK
jgi:hypothetical protein